MRVFMWVLAAGWLGLSAVGLVFIAQDDEVVDAPAQVLCPTEDSCTVDYHDGAWHITKTED